MRLGLLYRSWSIDRRLLHIFIDHHMSETDTKDVIWLQTHFLVDVIQVLRGVPDSVLICRLESGVEANQNHHTTAKCTISFRNLAFFFAQKM